MVYSDGIWRCMFDGDGNMPPVASNVDFSGIGGVNNDLTGTYSYSDAEGDPEGETTFKWYRADDASGTNAIVISGADQFIYEYTNDDLNKYISFEVTPVAQIGQTPGLAVMSAYQGPVTESMDCGGDLLDSRDGKSYATVKIGVQCWMAENLNIGTMINAGANQTDNGTIEKYCSNNQQSNCDEYGGLYQWLEMMEYNNTVGSQGICPDGWHMPTNTDYSELVGFCGGTSVAGDRLKEAGTTHWNPGNNGNNWSGFTALGGGWRHTSGATPDLKNFGYFWTSNYPSTWYVRFNAPNIYQGTMNPSYGASVRCISDDEPENQAPEVPSSPSPSDQAVDQMPSIDLSWTCSDPEGDPLTYDVYIGENNPPTVMVSSEQSATTFDPGTLNYGTTYYWKVVAQDDHLNTSDGPVWSFTVISQFVNCTDVLVDDRDWKTYQTVTIGDQCWMAENLNIGTMVTGFDGQLNNGTIEKYCYNAQESYCDTYGGLYDWDEVMDYSTLEGDQGICPDGWHVPTDAEWCVLDNLVDAGAINCSQTGVRGTDVGGNLKVTGTTYWNSPNSGATNSSGFNALGAGIRPNTAYYDIHNFAFFWTSTQAGGTAAYDRRLFYQAAYEARDTWPKSYGISVRCINDNAVPDLPPSQPSNPTPADNSTVTEGNTDLSWSCSDPNNDPLTYDVYFGGTNPPPSVSTGQSATTYDPGTLNVSTTYYWKIVAHDDQGGTTEGAVWSFTTAAVFWSCGDGLLDVRDNQTYATVQIGSQCWMAENINIGSMLIAGTNQADNGTIEKYCNANSATQCDVYGGLYQWDEAMQYVTTAGTQGICPTGWHMPTDDDWCTLENEVDAGTITCTSTGFRGVDAGGNMKVTGTTYWLSPNTGATNSSGFGALGAGYHSGSGFSALRDHAYFVNSSGGFRYITYGSALIGRQTSYPIANGISVRCIMD